MSGRKDTWMPTYWGDYVRDTGHLNALGHGAYCMLIKHYWCNGGPLVDDDTQLWRLACCDSLAEWRKVRSSVECLFYVFNGLWVHKRVEEELRKAEGITAGRSAAGKTGAAARWQTHRQTHRQTDGKGNGKRIANASFSQWQNDAQPQPPSQVRESPSSIGDTAARARLLAEGFLNIRKELWNDPTPVPLLTLQTQATDLLASYPVVPPDRIMAIIEAKCRQRHATGASAINSLRYFSTSIQDAAASASTRAPNGHADTRSFGEFDIGEKAWRLHLDWYVKRPDADWTGPGPSPGLPGCGVPVELLAEYAERLKVKPPDAF